MCDFLESVYKKTHGENIGISILETRVLIIQNDPATKNKGSLFAPFWLFAVTDVKKVSLQERHIPPNGKAGKSSKIICGEWIFSSFPGGNFPQQKHNPSKIEWDLTNGPLSKLLEVLDTQV